MQVGRWDNLAEPLFAAGLQADCGMPLPEAMQGGQGIEGRPPPFAAA